MRYVHRRVIKVNHQCGGRMPASLQEEVVAEVLLQLMDGGLARFRGGSIPELLGFVRTIADRCTWRTVRRSERERQAMMEPGAESIRDWASVPPSPDEMEFTPDSPLPASDQEYLVALLDAGSKAELARRSGVSRAAVTQRIQRIRRRVDALVAKDRMAHEVWLKREARGALERAAEIQIVR